jgi:ribose transport system substrate-binding protein
MKSLANEFFKDMEEGAVKHVQERGDLTLVPVGMHSETDIDTQKMPVTSRSI